MATAEFSGERLKAAREKAGMSREELGDLAGRHKRTVYWYESGRFAIPLIVARAFAAILDVDIDDLRKPEPKRRRRATA